MKKILSLVLTLSMLATNLVPVYASTNDANAKKVLFETALNTLDQISAEMYNAEALATYESTSNKFFTNILETNKFTLSTANTYNFDDETMNTNIDFTYNDDGSSILVDYKVNGTQFGEDLAFTGTFYLDDTKIVVDSDKIAEQPLVYNFGDSLGDPYLDQYINFFKYSSIKKYLNLFVELETSGKLDAIANDYLNNLLIYVGEADFTYENNTVTMVIDDELIEEYLYQLVTKLKNDKNIKEIFDRLDLPFSYDEIFTDELAAELDVVVDEMFADSGDDFEFTYTGVIQNNVLAQNKLVFSTPDSQDTLTLEFNFNDVKNGLLSDADLSIYDSSDFLRIDTTYSLKDNNGEKTFTYEVKSEDIVFSEGSYTYSINSLSQVAEGEIVTYSKPFFYTTEKPNYAPDTKEEWLDYKQNMYNDDLLIIEEQIKYAQSQIDKINNTTSTAYVDKDIAYAYGTDMYTGYFNEYINLEDGKVLNKEGLLRVLNEWIERVTEEKEFYIEYKEDLKLNANEQYADYLESYDDYYQVELQEYNDYLTYISNGKPHEALKQIIYTESVLSDVKLTGIQKQDVYQNDKLLTKSYVEYALEKSNTKNTISVKNTLNLVDYFK